MNRLPWRLMAAGLVLAVLISNIGSIVSDGLSLERLRSGVLRLHILANSDSDRDQQLKLAVRDSLLESGFFSGAENIAEAEEIAENNLSEAVRIAEDTLRKNGCGDRVSAELADVEFDERAYGDITMPAGTYKALRIKIGRAEGHNWWCVMYPPLCLPAACGADSRKKEYTEQDKDAVEECFDKKQLDMLCRPRRYKVRFAIWDKLKELLEEDVVQNDKNKETP